jgi:hypothetical protein
MLLLTAPITGRAGEKDDKIKALENKVADLVKQLHKEKKVNEYFKGLADQGIEEMSRKEYGIGEGHPNEVVDATIKRGDIVTVVASGVVQHGHPFIAASGPKGAGGPAPGENKFPAPHLEKYSLVGKFNDGGWELLGDAYSKTWVNTNDGKLTLGYNDDQPNNNGKSLWTVTVVVTRPKK